MPNLTEQQLAQATDSFVLSFKGIDFPAPYPAYGNGYFGGQIPREGQGIKGIPQDHARGLTLIHGVYTDNTEAGEFIVSRRLHLPPQPGLAEVPAWSGFAYFAMVKLMFGILVNIRIINNHWICGLEQLLLAIPGY